jgi:hypothetical protein
MMEQARLNRIAKDLRKMFNPPNPFRRLRPGLQRSIPGPTSLPRSYSDVHVLSFVWAEDLEDKIKFFEIDGHSTYHQDTDNLQRVFRNNLNFSTEIFTIPVQKSSHRVEVKVRQFEEQHRSEDTLLIVCYRGCGDLIDTTRTLKWM